MRARRRHALLSLIPALLLSIVAIAQVRLTRTELLTPWKGGGFGMFSTTDDGVTRRVGIRVSGSDGEREIAIPPPLYRHALEAVILPSHSRLVALGRRVADFEATRGGPVSAVRIAVWRMAYDPQTLEARPVIVRDVLVPVPGVDR